MKSLTVNPTIRHQSIYSSLDSPRPHRDVEAILDELGELERVLERSME
jgi:hypothetical protein